MQPLLTLTVIFGVAGWVVTGRISDGVGSAVVFLAICGIIAMCIRGADNKRTRELDGKQKPFLDQKRKEYEEEERKRAERLKPFEDQLCKDQELLDRLRKR